VALQLRRTGWAGARAILGGWDAWQKAGMPVEPRRWGRAA